jgi:sigma-B regulation protein RsbU (phosphoserine phosphatase)
MKTTENSPTAAAGDVGVPSSAGPGERSFGPLIGGDWASPDRMAQLGRDLEIARDIQQRLLPPSLPNLAGIEIGAALIAARMIGGDFYDFVPMPGGVGIAVGDVAGKGIPAALLMVMTRTLFRAAAREADTPGAILARVNRALCRDLPPSMFVTMVLAVLTLGAGRRLSVSNAGHVPPILLRRDSDAVALDVGGPIVGVFEDCAFEAQELVLARGDLVVMCTDGVVENPGRARLADGVHELIAASRAAADLPARTLAPALLDETRRRRGGTFHDDATLLVLKA